MLGKKGADYDPFMVAGGILVVAVVSFVFYATFLVPYGYMMFLDRLGQKIFAISFFIVAAIIWILHSDYITLATIFNKVSASGYGMEDQKATKESIKPNLDELKEQLQDNMHKGNKERVEELLEEVESLYGSAQENDKKRCKKYYLKIKNNTDKYLHPTDQKKITPEMKAKIEEVEKLYKEGLFTQEELEEKKNMIMNES